MRAYMKRCAASNHQWHDGVMKLEFLLFMNCDRDAHKICGYGWGSAALLKTMQASTVWRGTAVQLSTRNQQMTGATTGRRTFGQRPWENRSHIIPASVVKQNTKGRSCSAAGKVTADLPRLTASVTQGLTAEDRDQVWTLTLVSSTVLPLPYLYGLGRTLPS